MRRKLLWAAVVGVVVVVAVGGGVAWWFLASLDGRVARAIEGEGSRLTGTRVKVGAVRVSLRDAKGTIRDLRIANPDGFGGGDALRVPSITMTLEPATLRSNPLVVTALDLDQSRIALVMDAKGRSNLDVIRRNVESNAAKAPPDPDPLRFRIARVGVSGMHVEADMTAVGGTKEALDLDDIRLSNVGGRDGQTADLVAKAIIGAVVKETSRAATKAGLGRMLDKETGRLKDRIKGIFEK